MLDHDYDLKVKGSQLAWLEGAARRVGRPGDVSGSTGSTTLAASTWGPPASRPYRLERAAETLLGPRRAVLPQDRASAGATWWRTRWAAWCAGGLIQKVIPEQRGGDVAGRRRHRLLERQFTYATPHGGIAFHAGFGLFEKVRDAFGINGADIFGPERMWENLNPGDPGPVPKDWDPHDAR